MPPRPSTAYSFLLPAHDFSAAPAYVHGAEGFEAGGAEGWIFAEGGEEAEDAAGYGWCGGGEGVGLEGEKGIGAEAAG